MNDSRTIKPRIPQRVCFHKQALAGAGFQRAFTLIELVVVLVILGVMFAMAIPMFQGVVLQKRAEEIQQELMMTFRMAHQRSVFQQEQQDCVLDFSKNKYWLEYLQPGKHSRKLKRRPGAVKPLPKRYEFLMVYYPGQDRLERRRRSRILFFPDGTATEVVVLVGLKSTDGYGEYEKIFGIHVRASDCRVSLLDDEERSYYEGMI